MCPDLECLLIRRPLRVPTCRFMPAVMCNRRVASLDGFIDRVAIAWFVSEQFTAKAPTTRHHEAAVPWGRQTHEELDFVLFDTADFAMRG